MVEVGLDAEDAVDAEANTALEDYDMSARVEGKDWKREEAREDTYTD